MLPLLMLAQAVPTVPLEPVSGFYEILLHNGLMGGAVALLIYLLIKRDSDLQKSQEGRLDDAKNLAEVIKSQTVALTASNAAADERNRAVDAAARAAERSAIVIENLTKTVDGLNLEIKGLKHEAGK
jgi:hypothetical protein